MMPKMVLTFKASSTDITKRLIFSNSFFLRIHRERYTISLWILIKTWPGNHSHSNEHTETIQTEYVKMIEEWATECVFGFVHFIALNHMSGRFKMVNFLVLSERLILPHDKLWNCYDMELVRIESGKLFAIKMLCNIL